MQERTFEAAQGHAYEDMQGGQEVQTGYLWQKYFRRSAHRRRPLRKYHEIETPTGGYRVLAVSPKPRKRPWRYFAVDAVLHFLLPALIAGASVGLGFLYYYAYTVYTTYLTRSR